jgi:hypothetical protein
MRGSGKGITNNPNGRPVGSSNKITMEIKTWIKKLIKDNRGQLEDDLKKMGPKERWQIIERLMQYTTPKMQSTSSTIELEMLSEDNINQIASDILNSLQDDRTD